MKVRIKSRLQKGEIDPETLTYVDEWLCLFHSDRITYIHLHKICFRMSIQDVNISRGVASVSNQTEKNQNDVIFSVYKHLTITRDPLCAFYSVADY